MISIIRNEFIPANLARFGNLSRLPNASLVALYRAAIARRNTRRG